MTTLAESRKWEKLFWPVLVSALLLALWHYSVVWTATKVFPSPLDVEKGLVGLVHKNVLWKDIADSLRRVALGFGLLQSSEFQSGWFLAGTRRSIR